MKFIGTKQVKVGDHMFTIKITSRAMIEFEQMSEGTIVDFKGFENLIQFFYCIAKAGDKEFKYTYDEFLDVIDDHYEETLTNFTKAISDNEVPSTEKK